MSQPLVDTANLEILGQTTALQTLARARQSQRLSSAYIFEGPSGVGKTMSACRFAADVLGLDEGGRQRIAAGLHPDVRIFAPRAGGNRNMPVDFIRQELLPWTRFAPFEAVAAFAIFPEADLSFPAHHPEAANAILKSLEEPRPNLHWILTAEHPERLLPTLRSRCQRLRFTALAPAVIETILSSHGVEPADRSMATALSAGRADLALRYAAEGSCRDIVAWVKRIDAAIDIASTGELVALSEALAREEKAAGILEALAQWYRDVACVALGIDVDPVRLSAWDGSVQERAAIVGHVRAAARVQRLQSVPSRLEKNANQQTTLDALLIELASCD